jgi:hypothetical protein
MAMVTIAAGLIRKRARDNNRGAPDKSLRTAQQRGGYDEAANDKEQHYRPFYIYDKTTTNDCSAVRQM